MFKTHTDTSGAFAALSPGQRFAFIAAAIGATFPALFLFYVRPIFWLAAFQLACLAVLAFIRWKAPGFRGSLIVFALAVIGCLASMVAGIVS